MEKIIFDIPMGKFLQEYFEKRLVYDISIGMYPHSNNLYNTKNVIQWITDVQRDNFDKFLFCQSIKQVNDRIVHFEVMITDSKRIEHKFNVWIDVHQMIRKVKLNKILEKIEL